jgi:hypothetical protein
MVKVWRDTGRLLPLPAKQPVPTSDGRVYEQWVYPQTRVLEFKETYTKQVGGSKPADPKPIASLLPALPETPEWIPPAEIAPATAETSSAPVTATIDSGRSVRKDNSQDLIELVDQAISALQLIREVAVRSETQKAKLLRRFEQILNEEL